MKKETAKRLVDLGELLIVIGSAIYVANLLGVDAKWMVPALCVIYALGLIPAAIGKLALRKFDKEEQSGQEAA